MILISVLAISAVSAAEDNGLSDNEQISLAVPDVNEIPTSSENGLLAADIQASESPQINITTKDTPYNERASVEITTNINATMPKVNIYVDGNSVKNLTLFMQGKGTYNIPANTYDVGSHTIEVTYNDATYGLISSSAILNIIQFTPIVNVDDVTVNVGDIVTIPFTVTDNKGKGIAGKANVTVFLNDGNTVSQIVEFDDTSKYNFDLASLFNSTNLFNGTALNISGLFNGSEFNISAVFNGTNFNISGLFNGTTFNLTALLNGTGLNTTNFNITGLLNGTGLNITALFNGTGINITGLFNGTGLNLTGLMDGTGLNLTGLLNGTDFSALFNGTDFSSKFNITSFDFEELFNTPSQDSSNSDSSNLLMISLSDAILKADRPNFDITNWTKGNSTLDILGIFEKLGINLTKIFGGNAKQHNATFDYPFDAGIYKILVTLLGDKNYVPVSDTAKLIVIGHHTPDTPDKNTTEHQAEAKKEVVGPVTGNPLAVMLLAVFAIFGLGFRKRDKL